MSWIAMWIAICVAVLLTPFAALAVVVTVFIMSEFIAAIAKGYRRSK